MVEQEHIDPIYKYIEEHVTNLRNDILFNELFPLQDRVRTLERIIIEQRMMVLWVRITHSIQTRMLTTHDVDQPKNLQRAHRILLEQVQWFYGAIREASDYAYVYNEWLSHLQESFSALKIDDLLRSTDFLPPDLKHPQGEEPTA